VEVETFKHRRELKRTQLEDRSKYFRGQRLGTHYMLLALLGRGGFSEVWKAYDLELQQYCAVKVGDASLSCQANSATADSSSK
jgi:tousled-like kinase